MTCCGPNSQTRKLLALEATPFFKALAGPSGAPFLEQIAKDGKLLKVKEGDSLDDVQLGTFVVVVEGELVHTEVRSQGARRSSTSSATGKVACVSSTADFAGAASSLSSEVLATRRVGDFFRLAGTPGGGKAAKLADLSRVLATQKSLVMLLTTAALSHALSVYAAAAAKEGSATGGAASNFASIVEEMIRDDLATIISKVPLFAPLDKRTKTTVAQLFSYEVVPPKSTVFNEGEKGDWFCILLHGELEVVQGGKKVATRSPPAFLGEIALLYNCERTASILCGEAVASVLSLRAEHFQRMLERVPDMRAAVESLQRSRIVYSVLKFCNVFGPDDTEEAKHEECAAIAKHVTVRLVQPGEVLVPSAAAAPADGTTGNAAFYMVYQGTLRRTQHDANGERSPKSRSVQNGGYAGGVALLRMDGTTEQISAKTSCLVLEASGEHFYSLMALLPSLHAELAIRAHGRKAPLDAVLRHPRAMDAFTRYQKAEYASESSEFYHDVANFRLLSEQGRAIEAKAKLEAAQSADSTSVQKQHREKLRRSAVEVVDEFVREGAMRQINVPAEMRQQIEKAVEDPDSLSTDVFDLAQMEIFNLMKKDTCVPHPPHPFPQPLPASPFPRIPLCDPPTASALAGCRASCSRSSSRSFAPP